MPRYILYIILYFNPSIIMFNLGIKLVLAKKKKYRPIVLLFGNLEVATLV